MSDDAVAFFMNGIGDSLINLPALRALSELFRGELTLIYAEHRYADVFNELPLKRRVGIRCWRVDEQRRFDVPAVLDRIPSCEMFVSLVPWRSPDLTELVRRLGPCRSIGFDRTFDVALPLDFTKHSADLAFDAVRVLRPTSVMDAYLWPPTFGEKADRAVAGLRGCLSPGTRCLTVHCDTLPEKMWPAERFNQVLDAFLDAHPEFVAFIVGCTDCGISVPGKMDRIIPSFGLRLTVSQALVARSDLFLGIDSSLLHVADLCSVPSVGIFGPTRAHEFGFLVAPNCTLQGECSTLEIGVAEVLEGLEKMISATS
jgi:hypothetical protein